MTRTFSLGLVLMTVLFCAACAGAKHGQGGKSHDQLARTAATNEFASSASAQAQQTAETNVVPCKAADDTAQNKRDADAQTLTPMDQGNSDLDRGITQQLRKAVMGGDSNHHFSWAAKNMKIITINGEVTLRGVVQNDPEKEAVQKAAEQIAGVRKVNNQLTVKQAAAH